MSQCTQYISSYDQGAEPGGREPGGRADQPAASAGGGAGHRAHRGGGGGNRRHLDIIQNFNTAR
jgi:hypothetical protein